MLSTPALNLEDRYIIFSKLYWMLWCNKYLSWFQFKRYKFESWPELAIPNEIFHSFAMLFQAYDEREQ